MSRMFYGVVLSESVYAKFGCRLTHARGFTYNKFDEKARERLWFMLSKEDSYVVCKAPRNGNIGDLSAFVNAGLLLDLRDVPEFETASSLHDYIMLRIRSRPEYIKLCHAIRDKLASEIDVPFRWNGAEMESLTNETLIKKASYMTGLNNLGRFWNSDGSFNANDVYVSNEKWIREAYYEALEMEPGQAKLYSLMFGMALKRDIIYVGSSPGLGWQKCLSHINFTNRIYSFDPQPLECLNLSNNVTHINKLVMNPEDIWSEVPPGSYDFIWDVRGDTSVNYSGHENVTSVVSNEIEILHRILECPITSKYIKRVNIKVKWDMINRYKFPDHARLFFLPFCWREDRPINELRAVFLHDRKYPIMNRIFDYHQMRSHVLDNRVDDLSLFYNTLLMRLDPICFMSNINEDVSLDVNLYCINWNEPSKIQRYLSRLKELEINIISSYFIKPSLREGEFELSEVMLLNFHMQIFDSRLLVKAKLEDLYFFTDCGSVRWYKHELVTAESFIIMDEEMRLRKLDCFKKYDQCRDDACSLRGGVFLKFPNVHSICDNIISPSGHALRMVTAHLDGRCSIGMFVLKIIYSFFRVRSSWVTYPRTQSATKLFGISLNLVDGYGEPVVDKLWHSLLEWVIGLECGYTLRERAINTDLSCFLNTYIVAKTKLGIEVSTYYNDRDIDYVKLQKKMEQHSPIHRGDSHELFDIYSNFRCDVIDYLLSFRAGVPEWQTLVLSLRLDKIVSEICLLRSAYVTLSEDNSSNIFSELLNMKSILAIARGRMGNASEDSIITCDISLWRYPLFLETYTRRDPATFLQLSGSASQIRFVWHLICDFWINNLKFRRCVRSEDLKKFKVPRLPESIEIDLVRLCDTLLPDGKVFTIDAVKKNFSNLTSIKV